MLNCIIAGVGGQGTVFASRLLGMAAMEAGLSVRGSETIGMAQRGGCVVSHLRMGDAIFSPLIPKGNGDVLLAFEPGEAVRSLHLLSPNAGAVVLDRAVQPSVGTVAFDYTAHTMIEYLEKKIKHLLVIDGEKIIAECGMRSVNVALLGAAAEYGLFPFSTDIINKVIQTNFNNRNVEGNIRALQYGISIVNKRKGAI